MRRCWSVFIRPAYDPGAALATVRIDTVANTGGNGSGTRFLYAHRLSDTEHAIFVVTNKHVVNGMRTGSLTFHKGKDGKPDLGNGFSL